MSHPFLKQEEPERFVMNYIPKENVRKFPEDRSIIIESNRKRVEIFIKQQAGTGIDWDGLEFVYKKELDPLFKLNRDQDLTSFLKDLYERYDEKYPIK